MQCLKITIFILFLLFAKFSLSNNPCKKSVEDLSGPKKIFHKFGINFIDQAFKRQLQVRRQERAMRESVKRWIQEIENGFHEQLEDIRVKRENVERELQSAQDHLKTAQNNLALSKRHSFDGIKIVPLESAVEQAEIQLHKEEVKLQELKERHSSWVLSTREHTKDRLRRIKREVESAEKNLISLKFNLEKAKNQLLVERRDRIADRIKQAKQNILKATAQVNQARVEFKQKQLALKELAEMKERQEIVLKRFTSRLSIGNESKQQ